jgi:Spy/CpxP family protein refolding chaperone
MKRTWVLMLGALLAGILIGAAGASWAVACRWKTPFHERLLDRFSSTLQLTPQQREQVGAILEAKRQRIDALRAEIRPKFDELRMSTGAEIRALLSPEQQTRFDEMETKRAQQVARWRERRKRGNTWHK